MIMRYQSHKKRQDLDAEINVVPFIDLLSCCIVFLMVVSVWSSYANIKAESLEIKKVKRWAAPLSTNFLISTEEDKVLTVHIKNNLDVELSSSVIFKDKRLISAHLQTLNLNSIKDALQYYVARSNATPHLVVISDDHVLYADFMQLLALSQVFFNALGLSLEDPMILESQGIRFK